jgi:hypothetical protein
MTHCEEDISLLAQRLSLATGLNRYSATSSVAPHAPLESLLTELYHMQDKLEDLQEQGLVLDCSGMAEIVGKWATLVTSVLGDLNVAENQRIEDIQEDVAWYNNNLAACEDKSDAACKEQIDNLDSYWSNAFAQQEKAWETQLEQQKQAYEIRLAEKLGSSLIPSDRQEFQSLAPLSTTSSPSELQLQRRDMHVNTADPTEANQATTSTMTYVMHLSSSKQKSAQLTDHSLAPPIVKAEDSAANVADREEVVKWKQDYEAQNDHSRARAGTLAGANTTRKEYVRQRHELGTSVSPRKRTLNAEMVVESTVTAKVSKKRRTGTS